MSTFEEHLNTARKLFEEEKYAEASAAYLEAIKTEPTKEQKAIIWAELSWLFYHQKQYERCIESVQNVLDLNTPYDAIEDLFRLMGFSYSILSQDDKAIDFLEKSLAIDSVSEKQQLAIFELLKIYFRLQKYTSCLKWIEVSESYFYQNHKEYWLSILFFKGFVKYYLNEVKEGEKIFEEILENAESDPRRATAFFGLAFISFHHKNYLNTINLCESVAKHDPEFFDMESVGFLTAVSFKYLGREDVFTKYYDELKKKYPNGRYRQELERLRNEGNGKE